MTDASTRVLFVVNNPAFFLSHRLLLAQAVRGIADVEVAGPAGEFIGTITELGFRYHTIPMARTSLNPAKDVVTLGALVWLFRDRQPDLVHLISIKPALYGGLAARIAGVPAAVVALTGLGYALASRDLSARVIRVIIRPLLKAAVNNPRARVILQNDDDARVLTDTIGACEPRLRVVRGSGVDPRDFTARPEDDGDPIVLFAGRLLRDKGVGEFLTAARLLRMAGTRARFVIAGSPDPQNPTSLTEEIIREHHAAGVIDWWGQRDDMAEVLARSHIVCLPTTYGEGVPKILIEAAACGRAIVATDWPGCRDIVRHNENGLLVEPRNPSMLACAIQHLVDRPAERRRMGARGRALVIERFSATHVIRDTLAVYKELLTPRPSRFAAAGV